MKKLSYVLVLVLIVGCSNQPNQPNQPKQTIFNNQQMWDDYIFGTRGLHDNQEK